MGSVMIAGNRISHLFVRKVVTAFILVVLSCLLFIALIMAGLIALYFYATDQAGFSAMETILAIVGSLVVIVAACVIATVHCLKKAVDGISTDFKQNIPLPVHIANQTSVAVHSFIDGLMNRNERKG